MKNISEFIESGIIEAYVLGMATPIEVAEVEAMFVHTEVRKAIDEFEAVIEMQALNNSVAPDPTIKPLVMAIIDYIERMEKGEPQSFPPMLQEGIKVENYTEWLDRSDMALPGNFKDIYAKIIAYTPQVTTAIVWIEGMAPAEVHKNELEKFLIVEGTCDIVIEEDVHSLVPGDYLSIPLHKDHMVKVTSRIPCKVILQRVAA